MDPRVAEAEGSRPGTDAGPGEPGQGVRDVRSHRVTIPIVIDAVRDWDGVSMARCVYFLAEADRATTGWTLGLPGGRIPFLMVGIEAVLYGPTTGADRFHGPDDIDAVYRSVESEPGLSIETSDLWLPTHVLGDPDVSPERGDVYRIGHRTFELAQAFVQERVARDAFLDGLEQLGELGEASPGEAEAFRAWGRAQIDEAIEIYPKSAEMRLRSREA